MAQLHYASLDAHSLIGILDALLLERGIESDLAVALPHYNIHEVLQQNIAKVQSLLAPRGRKMI